MKQKATFDVHKSQTLLCHDAGHMLGGVAVCWDFFISASGTELSNGVGVMGRREKRKLIQSAFYCIAGVDIALRKLEYIFFESWKHCF